MAERRVARAAPDDVSGAIRVAIIGTGFMGRALARHIESSVPDMQVAAVLARSGPSATESMRQIGTKRVLLDADSPESLDSEREALVIARDLQVILEAGSVDVVVDATGSIEMGIRVAEGCIESCKPLVSMNAEVDASVGSILNRRALDAGVVRSIADGDQPGVQLRLAEFAVSRGLVPRFMGNVKGLHDVHRTPSTQAAFAAQWGQDPYMVTSFADGTKVSFEQALVANVLGFGVLETGMRGLERNSHVDELVDELGDLIPEGSGLVDYVVGAKPSPGVFCVASSADPWQRHYLNLFKLGSGPWYSLYQPYHLCHLEVPATIRETVVAGVGLGQSAAGPSVEVVATAKTDLKAGTVLDGIGGYCCYGQAANVATSRSGQMLHMAAAVGARLVRAVDADAILTYDDVEVLGDRSIDRLLSDQAAIWG